MAFQELANVLSQTAPHGEILDELHAMLPLLTSGLEEQLGKARPVDCVPREVGCHGKVLNGGPDLLLHLLPHRPVAWLNHINPFFWYIRNGTSTFYTNIFQVITLVSMYYS